MQAIWNPMSLLPESVSRANHRADFQLQESVDSCTFPTVWTKTFVIAVFIKGSHLYPLFANMLGFTWRSMALWPPTIMDLELNVKPDYFSLPMIYPMLGRHRPILIWTYQIFLKLLIPPHMCETVPSEYARWTVKAVESLAHKKSNILFYAVYITFTIIPYVHIELTNIITFVSIKRSLPYPHTYWIDSHKNTLCLKGLLPASLYISILILSL